VSEKLEFWSGGSLVPELAELLFGSIGIFLFRTLLRYVGPQVIAATRARWF
jgi:hypothetical protein